MNANPQNDKSKNKGEWSEPYVFLRLAGSATLTAADAQLRSTNVVYPILKIFGNRTNTANWTYILTDSLSPNYPESGTVEIVDESSSETIVIPALEFTRHADLLLNEIRRERPATQRTFPVPQVWRFLEQVRYKEPSKKKSDIRVVLHDIASGRQPELGFSIKSYLGSKPTLFNASQSTRLKFRIMGQITEDDRTEINAIQGPKTRVRQVLDRADLVFEAPTNAVFERNLRVIDSKLPELLSEMVLQCFMNPPISSITAIVEYLAENDPLAVGASPAAFYEYKVKAMLTDMALGMTATDPWGGIYAATGGFIIVDNSGDVLCFHIYNRNDFQDLLFRTTKIDTPDDRTDYAIIMREGNDYQINLNFQIRFK